MPPYQFANPTDTLVSDQGDASIFPAQGNSPRTAAWLAAGGPAITAPFPMPPPTTTPQPTTTAAPGPIPAPIPIPATVDTGQLAVWLLRELVNKGAIPGGDVPAQYKILLP